MISLSFLAQSLDNIEPDVMTSKGKRLNPEDTYNRRDFAGEISQNLQKAILITNNGVVKAHLHGQIFILEVETQQVDARGRRAPVLVLGDLDEASGKYDQVVIEIEKFINSIERSVAPNTKDAIISALSLANDNKAKKKIFLRSLILLCLAILGILSFLFLQFQE